LLLPDESIEQLDLPLKMVSYVSSALRIECESATQTHHIHPMMLGPFHPDPLLKVRAQKVFVW
jgi:hypothetical protein